jgi:hypothetical protein
MFEISKFKEFKREAKTKKLVETSRIPFFIPIELKFYKLYF